MDKLLRLLIVLASFASVALAQQVSADNVPPVVRQALLLYEVHLEDDKEVLKTLFEENGTLVSQSSKPKKRI